MVNNQQVSMNLVYELWCNPAQGHPDLVLCHKVVILQSSKNNITYQGTGRANKTVNINGRPFEMSDLVSAVRKAIVSDLN